MRNWTYGELKEKLEKEMDLQGEDFISPEELMGLFNDAIDSAEASVHTLYEDYYLTSDNLALVSDQANYPMPTDIYVNKLRSVTYDNGSDKYEIKRWKKPLSQMLDVNSGDAYQYIIINSNVDGFQQKFIPASREDSATHVTRWYIRNANVITAEADRVDVPDTCIAYILQFVKEKCYEKEGHPNTLKAIEDTKSERADMIETLTNMVDDEDTSIPLDLEFYENHT